MKLFEFDKTEKNTIQVNLFQKTIVDHIIGTDEAGRGCGAGGVFASAVCFFQDVNEGLFSDLNDSKKLTPKKREELFDIIIQNSYYSIKMKEVEVIESINILNASLSAMREAVEDVISQIKSNNILVLVDGNRLIKNFSHSQKTVIKGDSKSASVSAASILAKVSRDRYMDELNKTFPNYGWDINKGYLTKKHIEAIKKNGATKYHRLSFLKNII